MRNLLITGLVSAMVLVASYSIVRGQQPAPVSASSLTDGIYSGAQAMRGETVYGSSCASCHGPMLAGDVGPSLVGKDFIADFKDGSLGDLLDRIAMTMPQNAPGSLMPAQYADVLAYMLSMNKYPAGMSELGSDAAALKVVKMVDPPQP